MLPGKGGPDGLNPDDPGVRLLGDAVRGAAPESRIQVHSGEVPGVSPGATRLILDVRERAGSVHRCFSDLAQAEAPPGGCFQQALVWPRAHLGKDFSALCLATAALAVGEGGRVLCAARKAKGGKSLAKVLEGLLGDVQVIARDRGYHLYSAHRGPDFDPEGAQEIVGRRYELRDPLFGPGMVLDSVPGVFSRKALDDGTRALLEVASALAEGEGGASPIDPGIVLDLCAGVGPLGLWAARRWPAARVLAVESNLRASACLRSNFARMGMLGRLELHEGDGLPTDGFTALRGRCDLALINPPTHAERAALTALLSPLPRWLGEEGRVLLVVNRPGMVVDVLREIGARIDGGERNGYLILQARW